MKRLLTGILAAALAVAAVSLLDSLWILVISTVVLELAAFELVRLTARLSIDRALSLLLVAVPLLSWSLPLLGSSMALALLAASPLLVAALMLGSRAEASTVVGTLGWFSFGVPYLVLPAWSLYEVHRHDAALVLVLLVSVWANDSVAFVVGSRFGRHRMAPRLSPMKTWEGSAAGLTAGVIAAMIGMYWKSGTWSVGLIGVFLLIGVAAQAGDLVESLLKRASGVKDSGTLMPGHGGMLDRLDAIILASPVFYALLRFGTLE